MSEACSGVSALDRVADLPVLGMVESVGSGWAPALVARVTPRGPRGLWRALEAVGAVASCSHDDATSWGELSGLHLDPRVNDSHLAFLASV
jgi:hypothetical protein